jgi:hypothetical protein
MGCDIKYTALMSLMFQQSQEIVIRSTGLLGIGAKSLRHMFSICVGVGISYHGHRKIGSVSHGFTNAYDVLS